MKLSPIILAILVTLSILFGLSVAAYAVKVDLSFPDKTVHLSGKVITGSNQSYSAVGNAVVTITYKSLDMKPGTIRLDSMNAEKIQVDMTTNVNKKQVPKKAVASGGVVIHGRRLAPQVGSVNGVIQEIKATGQTATMIQAENTVTLDGNVVIKTTEVGEEVASAEGSKAVMSLKENNEAGGWFTIEGEPGGQAEITSTTKEKPKSAPLPK